MIMDPDYEIEWLESLFPGQKITYARFLKIASYYINNLYKDKEAKNANRIYSKKTSDGPKSFTEDSQKAN